MIMSNVRKTAFPRLLPREYQQLIRRIQGAAEAVIPRDTTVLVVTRGDDDLLDLNGRRGWHFPCDEAGNYAGYHPPDSAAAILHLEQLRARGAQYLLFPSTTLWWLEHYAELSHYLERHARLIYDRPDMCLIFALDAAPSDALRTAASHGSRPASLPAGREEQGGILDTLFAELQTIRAQIAEGNATIGRLYQELIERSSRATHGSGAQQGPDALAALLDDQDDLHKILLHLCDQLLQREDALQTLLDDMRQIHAARPASASPSQPPAEHPAPAEPAIASAARSHAAMEAVSGPSDRAAPDTRLVQPAGWSVPALTTRISDDTGRAKVSVVAWDAGHNPLGRAYLLADMLRERYDVELIGATFPRFGNAVWEPLRQSEIPMHTFAGQAFPDHYHAMKRQVEGVRTDVVIVSKPRLPSYELGMLLKLENRCPLILDIDDFELSFFPDRTALTLDEIRARAWDSDLDCAFGSTWTRYCESIIPAADFVTTSNDQLKQRYGGIVMPHARDERIFNPARFDRDAIRARYGYTPGDRVILFVGTPRIHKGFLDVARALAVLGIAHYKLCVIGSVVDRTVSQQIDSLDPRFVQFVPNQSFQDLPELLCLGDLVCLIQDREHEVSNYQIPAKFTDAVAMGIPVLANDVPPLRDLAGSGLVEPLRDRRLEEAIDTIFSNYADFKRRAMQNRRIFVAEYSYAVNATKLANIIELLREEDPVFPQAFSDLLTFHQQRFNLRADMARKAW